MDPHMGLRMDPLTELRMELRMVLRMEGTLEVLTEARIRRIPGTIRANSRPPTRHRTV